MYRFEYPEFLFKSLRSIHALSNQIQVLDLGCGTGLVTESFLKFNPDHCSVHLLDPDAEMLKQAQIQLSSNPAIRSFVCASAEQTPFSQDQFDLILVGSAWHWMNQKSALLEMERVLKPGGMVFIFEYQFPKCINYSELNDWIRLKFNSHWKPTTQTPRGSLKELTECWRIHSEFSQWSSSLIVQERQHSSSELAGVIVSQSRYQHYEQTFHPSERMQLRIQLEQDLDVFLKGKSGNFTYSYEGYVFKKRP